MRCLRTHAVIRPETARHAGRPTRHHRRALRWFMASSLCIAGLASAVTPIKSKATPSVPATPRATQRPGAAGDTVRQTALSVTLVLKVADPKRAREALLKTVRAAGGRPSLITDHSLHLRVPPQQLHKLLANLPDYGLVIDKQLTRRDLTEEIARLRGRIRSKSTILARLRGFLDDSGVSATLQVERTMTTLVHEIEQLKGGLRVALDQAAMAHVRLSFRFRTPTQLRYVRSPFGWIDTVDIPHFLRGF